MSSLLWEHRQLIAGGRAIGDERVACLRRVDTCIGGAAVLHEDGGDVAEIVPEQQP